MIRIARRPTSDETVVLAHLADRYGLDGTLSALPGERDLNFLLVTGAGGHYVVKATSPDEPEASLAFETDLMAWLAREGGVPTPAVVPDREGRHVTLLTDGDGAVRVRVLEHLPGRILAAARPRPAALLEDLGAVVARLGEALRRYPGGEPPPRADFEWALERAASVVERGLAAVGDPTRRDLLERARTAFLETDAVAAALPRQLVHGDVNDHNVLVTSGDASGAPPRVSAVLDFGDAHAAPAVYDVAIAAAYALLDQPDPVAAAARVVGGYHRVRALAAEELSIVVPLVRARLAASVAIAAWRRGDDPEPDPYLLVSEAPAWRALAALDAVPAALSAGLLREACGLVPCSREARVSAWLESAEPVAVVEPPRGGGVCVLDLSVASPLLDGDDTDDVAAFTRRVFEEMAARGATLGVGRWQEPRGFYLTDAFAGRPAEMPERRTVHLGVDVFVDAGTPVRAPLPGRVASVADHAARLDYGPTVIVEHDTPYGPVWTLYGHLEQASVARLETGAELAAGQPFARVGAPPENGDWPPHLHLQLLLDRPRDGDAPGVGSVRERRVWASLCPDPSPLLGLDVDARWPEPTDLGQRRARLLAPSLSLSYARPIHVVRGRGAHLHDLFGRVYLDCVNNVAHVGHEHPRVVAAGRRQMGLLNTNTRYLHDSLVRYAERLTALFPDPLAVCVFVNSGSEANELALRMARAHTDGRGVVALEGGYHGNTGTLVDVSHYKHARAGGEGAPDWVRVSSMPDDYRGRFRRDDPERAAKYALHVRAAYDDLLAAGVIPAAFLCESVLSCGGQVVPPDGYLAAAYAHARAAGAVCIADEVQVGFGRVGSHMWGFEAQGVVPDIVTLGKPMGNGHPLGAVVTTRAIADSFDNGMEFFSTYGGNPVSCEIGLAVLDVIADEGLMPRAAEVGGKLLAGLDELRARHAVVGDARGLGLFLGLELVSDPEARTPSATAARYVVSRMKERGVLLSTDGPDDNVIKIKPPLVFSADDGRRLLAGLDDVLGEDPVAAALAARER